MNILAISGSLRAASINSAFCRVAARLATPPLRVSVFAGLSELPLFNPDLDSCPPSSVQDFRAAIDRADALLIASPEYAHGISGPLKNALDWLVSYEGTVHKPLALINTSPRARHAYEALREVLQTMSTVLIDEASISIPLLGSCITEEAMLAAPEVCRAVATSLAAIAAHLGGRGTPGPSFPLL